MLLQNWSTLNKSGGGPWPEERSSHAACCLNYGQQFPQSLVTGGLDRHRQPLADIWILDVHRGKWRKVRLKPTKLLLLGIYNVPTTPWEVLFRYNAEREESRLTTFSLFSPYLCYTYILILQPFSLVKLPDLKFCIRNKRTIDVYTVLVFTHHTARRRSKPVSAKSTHFACHFADW